MDKKTVESAYLRILKEKKGTGVPTKADLLAAGVPRALLETKMGGMMGLEKKFFATHPNLFPVGHQIGSRSRVSLAEILLKYSKLRKRMGKTPSHGDIDYYGKEFGITEYEIVKNFRNISNCEDEARKQYPEYFEDTPISHIDVKLTAKHISKVTNSKHLFITTAVSGQKLNAAAYAAVKNWEKIWGGKLVILVASDPASQKSTVGEEMVDSALADHELVVTENIQINENLYISKIMVTAKQIDPTWGLDRITQKFGSSIFASPKQRLKSVGVDDPYKHRNLMTPGAITDPNYASKYTVSQRTADIAEADHMMGGIIVDIDEDGLCFPRVVQFDSNDGSFVDMGIRYTQRTYHLMSVSGLIPGDWHAGETCQMYRKAIKEACTLFKPRKMVAHDLYNGLYINPHEHSKIISLVRAKNEHKMSFLSELMVYKDEINFLSSNCDELFIANSNHDNWLKDYLDNGRFNKDRETYQSCLKMADAMVSGKDPLKFTYEELFKQGEDHNITWLQRSDKLYIENTACHYHGHIGLKGKRNPNLKMFEQALKDVVVGHGHDSEIMNYAMRVGTGTPLIVGYSEGQPTNWNNSFVNIYSNGSKQLLFVFKGRWRSKRAESKIKELRQAKGRV